MHFDPGTISIFGTALVALASLVLHFTPSYTIAGKAATWIEEHEKELEAVADLAANAAQPKK